VVGNPLGAIWIRPADYREALKQTDFEMGRKFSVYRRQAEREKSVERLIKRVSLTDGN
jgi:hypothetical protein